MGVCTGLAEWTFLAMVLTIRTEADAKKLLDWLGTTQSVRNARCPRCGDFCKKLSFESHQAKIKICHRCYGQEWGEAHGLFQSKILLRCWRCIIEIRNVGVWVE